MKENRPVIFFDMDNTLVDFQSGIDTTDSSVLEQYGPDNYYEVPEIFSRMKPTDGAIDAVNRLSQYYDIQILSTAPWKNPSAWTDKLNWIKEYFPTTKERNEMLWKRVTISHHKDNLCGYALIDDNMNRRNGASRFHGRRIRLHLPGLKSFLDHDNICATDLAAIEECYSLAEVLTLLVPKE